MNQDEILTEDVKEIKTTLSKLSKDIRELTNSIKAYRKKELSLSEAATFLGVEPKTINNRVYLGQLVGFKKGKFRYFHVQELEDYLADRS